MSPEARLAARAQLRVQTAIRRGVLVRPDACETCGGRSRTGYPTIAHHRDYSRPLDVTWLCGSCHYLEHYEIRRGNQRSPFAGITAPETTRGALDAPGRVTDGNRSRPF